MKKTLLSAFAVCLLFGCQDDDSQTADTNTDPIAIEFELVRKGAFDGEQVAPDNFVINSQEEWDTFIEVVSAGHGNISWANMELDFNNKTYIASLDDWHPHGGHATEIISIAKENGTLNVAIEDFDPAEDEPVPLIYCQPFHIVEIEKTALPVLFN